ncbi:vegetative storage protein 1 [Striga asiatica]|uniref:Vegetative storage protein 1 n=1 Tax=Striga asiatica TaxID=4170 RepID=A0A5A7PX74_STRAF|nr:vegetative storage protein 1 [Striga asiatica]
MSPGAELLGVAPDEPLGLGYGELPRKRRELSIALAPVSAVQFVFGLSPHCAQDKGLCLAALGIEESPYGSHEAIPSSIRRPLWPRDWDLLISPLSRAPITWPHLAVQGTSSLATDSATFSSHVLSKEDVLLSSVPFYLDIPGQVGFTLEHTTQNRKAHCLKFLKSMEITEKKSHPDVPESAVMPDWLVADEAAKLKYDWQMWKHR